MSKKNRMKGSRARVLPAATAVIPRPVPFSPSNVFPMQFRFECTTFGNYLIKRSDMTLRLCLASSTTVAYSIFNGVKINSIEIFGTTPVAGSSTNIELQWLSENGPNRVLSDSSSSSAYPPRIQSRPPAGSLAGFWSLTGQDPAINLFSMQVNNGDIITLNCTVCLQDPILGGPVPVAQSVTGGTAGSLGAPSLDHTAGTNDLVPVGWADYH